MSNLVLYFHKPDNQLGFDWGGLLVQGLPAGIATLQGLNALHAQNLPAVRIDAWMEEKLV